MRKKAKRKSAPRVKARTQPKKKGFKKKRTALRSMAAPDASAGGQKIVTALGEINLGEKIITNSARGTFLDCRKKFLWEYAYRLATRGITDYFWVGSVCHEEWDLMYQRGKFAVKPFRKRLNAAIEKALALCVNEDQSDKVWKGGACIGGLIPSYAEHYLERDLDQFEIVATETRFEPIEIPNTSGWRYGGIRDMLVREGGELGLWENKTAGGIDAGYIARLPLDFQILGYVWATQTEMEEELDFIMYNIAQKTKLRGRQGEAFPSLLERIAEDYAVDPTKYFYRERVPFDQRSVKNFVKELSAFCGELDRAIKDGYWSMNTRRCADRGICPMMPLCIEGPKPDLLLQYRRKASQHEELESKKKAKAA